MKMEDSIKARMKEQATLLDTSAAVISTLDVETVLDRILELYVERDFSADDIVATGMDREQVQRVLRLVDINEYKRRQAPIGVRITRRGFGRDRRYPITSGWTIGN